MLKKRTIAYLKNECRPLEGKAVVVTGASSGIGLKASEELAWLGAHVIMACRNLRKAEEVRKSILNDNPAASLEVRLLDIGSSDSIKAFVSQLEAERTDVFAFVNNAGVFKVHGTTKDGLEIVSGTNYHGTKMMSEAVLPYLKSLEHEVILTFTSSISYRVAPSEDKTPKRDFNIYAQSKLCLTKYAVELGNSLSASNVKVVVTHPGISVTPIAARAFGERFMNLVTPLASLFIQSPEKSALAIPYVLSNDVDRTFMYGPHGFLDGWGYPEKIKLKLR